MKMSTQTEIYNLVARIEYQQQLQADSNADVIFMLSEKDLRILRATSYLINTTH